MAILCPYCQHGLSLKDVKPGRYKPKCPKCTKPFLLSIPTDPSQPPQTAALADAPASAVAPAAPPAPVAPPQRTVVAPPGPKPGNVDATLMGPGIEATLPAPSRPAPADPNLTIPVRSSDLTAPGRSAQETAAMPHAQHAAGADDNFPQQIGGYKISRELGRGAMGAVYLARQISLDRDVALKVIQAQWARDPTFIARFTREAYAAAQLNHHNMVQIYDLGSDGDLNFFSMEFVRGQSLSDLLEKEGKLEPDVAIGYVLQAARGLHYAHSHGMVHRDVKPANLMLNDVGVVKVADLGLVKTPQMSEPETPSAGSAGVPDAASAKMTLSAATADVTLANVAMGTPAYMAPEQSANAAGVDHRADIYSLGCTLYVLLTGRPPFEGASALEVITKHRSEPVVRPDVLVKRIPKELADVTLKMVAKLPDDRYPHLGEVIRDLERYLGVQSSGPFSPKEDQVQLLEQNAAAYNGAALAKLRLPAALGFLAFCGLIFVFAMLMRWVTVAGGALGLGVMTVVGYFLYSGWMERTHLFDKFRELLALARWSDWLTWLGGGLLLLLLLFVFGFFWSWVVFALFAVGCALAYYYLIDRRLAAQRQEPLAKINELLKSLRIKGVEETALRQFVGKYSGDQWEELFEALFGFEAKLEAREQFGRGEQGRRRSRFRAWREPLVRWIGDRARGVKEAKERKYLKEIEEKNLKAQGMDAMQARRQAERMADALVDDAAQTRAAPPAAPAQQAVDPAELARKKREKQKQMLAAARAGEYPKQRKGPNPLFAPITIALGPKMRFLLGCLLLVGFGLWAKQNNVFTVDASAVTDLTTAEGVAGAAKAVKVDASQAGQWKPLALPLVGGLFDFFNPGLAGLVLVALGMFRGWKMSLFALPAAAIIFLGPHLGVPSFGISFGAYALSALVGLSLAALGFLYGQTFEEFVRVE